jgi:hypothetical protein
VAPTLAASGAGDECDFPLEFAHLYSFRLVASMLP